MTVTASDSLGWRLGDDIAPSCHAVSRDGSHALIGASDGRLLLVDRRGAEIWRYAFKQRVESVLCTDDGRMFLAGTWGGELCACINEGLMWSKDFGGVVSALAVSSDGDRIAAGSWAGQVGLYRRDGTPSAPTMLPDAVVALALHSSGTPIYAVLANHTLVVLESDGRERWRKQLNSKLRYVAQLGYDLLVATEAGTLLWLNDHGGERMRREISTGLEHLAASRDGAWVAWVDRQARLTFWHPLRDQGFRDFKLPQLPDALAVTGQGDGAFCSVALPDAKILTFNRYRRNLEIALPGRIRNASFSGSGTSATALSHDGSTVFYVDLLPVKHWLPRPNVIPRITAELVMGQVGTVTVDLTNQDGCRAAHGVEVTIASEFLTQSAVASVATIESGKTVRMVKPFEPRRPGKLPIMVTLSYEDELKTRFSDQHEDFVRVGAGSQP